MDVATGVDILIVQTVNQRIAVGSVLAHREEQILRVPVRIGIGCRRSIRVPEQQDAVDRSLDVETVGRVGTALDRGFVRQLLMEADLDAVPAPLGMVLVVTADVREVGEGIAGATVARSLGLRHVGGTVFNGKQTAVFVTAGKCAVGTSGVVLQGHPDQVIGVARCIALLADSRFENVVGAGRFIIEQSRQRVVPKERILDQEIVAQSVVGRMRIEVLAARKDGAELRLLTVLSVGRGGIGPDRRRGRRKNAVVGSAAVCAGASFKTVAQNGGQADRFIRAVGVEIRVDRKVDRGVGFYCAADGAVDRLSRRMTAVGGVAGVVDERAPDVVVRTGGGVVERAVEIVSVNRFGTGGGVVDPGDRMHEIVSRGHEDVAVGKPGVRRGRSHIRDEEREDPCVRVDIGVGHARLGVVRCGKEFVIRFVSIQVGTTQDRNDLAVDVDRDGQFVGCDCSSRDHGVKVGHVLVVDDADPMPAPFGVRPVGPTYVRVCGIRPAAGNHTRMRVARLGGLDQTARILERAGKVGAGVRDVIGQRRVSDRPVISRKAPVGRIKSRQKASAVVVRGRQVQKRLVPEDRVLDHKVVAETAVGGVWIEVLAAREDLGNLTAIVHSCLSASADPFLILDVRLDVVERDLQVAAGANPDDRALNVERSGTAGPLVLKLVNRVRRMPCGDTDGERGHVGVAGASPVGDERTNVERAVKVGVRDVGQFDRDPEASRRSGDRRIIRRDRAVNGLGPRLVAVRAADRRGGIALGDDEADLGVVKLADGEDEPEIGIVVVCKIERRKGLILEILDLGGICRGRDRNDHRNGDDHHRKRQQDSQTLSFQELVHDGILLKIFPQRRKSCRATGPTKDSSDIGNTLLKILY